jgi:uncharacterized protein
VLYEACFLVRHAKAGQNGVLGLVGLGIVALDFLLSSEFEAVRKLMAKYASVPMSLADARLVRMTELPTRAAVVTLDGELRVYRRNGRQVLPVIMPD